MYLYLFKTLADYSIVGYHHHSCTAGIQIYGNTFSTLSFGADERPVDRITVNGSNTEAHQIVDLIRHFSAYF